MIFLTSEKYCLTNQKRDMMFSTSEKKNISIYIDMMFESDEQNIVK